MASHKKTRAVGSWGLSGNLRVLPSDSLPSGQNSDQNGAAKEETAKPNSRTVKASKKSS